MAAGSALAQDPRGAIAQKAARDWLALTDDANALGSWNAAGAKFKESTPAKRGARRCRSRARRSARATSGPCCRRLSARSSQACPTANTRSSLFRTSFANRADSRETVTLEREADGAWRVIGYVIR